MIKVATLSVMFSLLFSTAAMAADHISQKSIKDINITETGKIFIETNHNKYEGEFIQHCPVKKYIDLTVLSGNDNLGLYSHGSIKPGSKITFLDQKERTVRKKRLGSCKIESLEVIS